MSDVVSFAAIAGQQVELLPARTLLQTGGGGGDPLSDLLGPLLGGGGGGTDPIAGLLSGDLGGGLGGGK